MRRIIATLSFLMILMSSSFAQNSEHLKFKGVPIDGTLNEYVSKMKQAGFVLEGTEDGIALLSGEFAGYSDCIVGVQTLQKLNLVHEIVVLFPSQDKWSGLSYDYERLKTMLTKKYGAPDECIERFNSPSYRIEDDNDKMREVRMNNCKYYSTYNTDNGSISLTISNDGYGIGCRVKLFYSDKTNSEIFDEAAMEDL
ncbi:MAG: hypothetical protein IIW55_02750 [Bacteroidales bacterium]|jgi:hypothetical protein|nr:hypothetical protein [Bacteroidales bacterium]